VLFSAGTSEGSWGICVWSEWNLYQIESFQVSSDGHRLRSFVSTQSQVHATDSHFSHRPKLYFVKVDVQACFDTIDQTKLLEILRELISEVSGTWLPADSLHRPHTVQDDYMIQRYGQVSSMEGKPQRKYRKKACPEGSWHSSEWFLLLLCSFWLLFNRWPSSLSGICCGTCGCHRTYNFYWSGNRPKTNRDCRWSHFLGKVVYPFAEKQEILQLLEEHITDNIVKVGHCSCGSILH